MVAAHRPAQAEAGGDRDQLGQALRASAPGRARPRRPPRRAARPGCSSRTAGRPPRAASTGPADRSKTMGTRSGARSGCGSVTATWCRTPPAGTVTPASAATSAISGPPVSTTSGAVIGPAEVRTPVTRAASHVQAGEADPLAHLDAADGQGHGVGGDVARRRRGSRPRRSRCRPACGRGPGSGSARRARPGSSHRTSRPSEFCMAIRSRAALTSASVKHGMHVALRGEARSRCPARRAGSGRSGGTTRRGAPPTACRPGSRTMPRPGCWRPGRGCASRPGPPGPGRCGAGSRRTRRRPCRRRPPPRRRRRRAGAACAGCRHWHEADSDLD